MEDQHNEKDVEIEQNVEIEKDAVMEPEFEMEPAEIDPDVLERVELIEYLYSSQGKKDMDDYMDDVSVPSFSLGINGYIMNVCKDINNDHGESQPKAQGDDNDMVTPAPAEHEKKDKRKLDAPYRSPYVRRIIDLKAKYTTQNYAIWRWIIQEGQDLLEHVFVAGDLFCIRKHMATLRPRERLYYSVIDVWSALMNEKETYKAP